MLGKAQTGGPVNKIIMEPKVAVCSDVENGSHHKDSKPSHILVVLFTATVFWASALLFLLEPMFAKMILPVFGGSPAVWNTSMVFFQSALFLAYIYSHYVAERPPAQTVWIHSLAAFVPLLVLPISIHAASNLNTVVTHPAAAVLMIAVSSIGLPFFFVATSAPLLQRWFSQTTHRNASDPYFLYAASNAGSLIGLALYPYILEPKLKVGQQAFIWSIGYAIVLGLTLACGLAAYRWRMPSPLQVTRDQEPVPHYTDKLLWAVLAFVPASLLYAFTAQLSIDFPPIPLLWVIPLALYLFSFIVAFSTRFEWFSRTGRALPTIIVCAMMFFLFCDARPGLWGVVGLAKLCCFAVMAVAFHTEVARRRPARQYLTEYYLWISAGGILGGLLNSFIAPVVFSDFWEYPLTVLVSAALLPAMSAVSRRPISPRIACSAIAVMCTTGIAMQLMPAPLLLRTAVTTAGAIVCIRVPVRWTAAALLLISLSLGRSNLQQPLYEGRSFFGRYRVTTDAEGKWHSLTHGTTIHGVQRMDDPLQRTVPRSYYQAPGGVFAAISGRPSANIAIVGLGTGALGCYSRSEQSTTFFEIDPLVARIASDTRYFTFLSECSGRKNIALGDARLTLSKTAPRSFDLIVLDAFSSDAIPLHLLTREAFDLYREKLTVNGLLLVHI